MPRRIVSLFIFMIGAAVWLTAQGGRGGFAGGGFAGGAKGGAGRIAIVGGSGRRGFRGNRGFGYGYGYGAWYSPYAYDSLDWDLPYWDYVNFPPSDDYSANPAYPPPGYGPAEYGPPPVRPQPTANVPQRYVASPKLIEVPESGKEPAERPQPPAVFVLNNGEHLESSHYVLSAESAQIEVGRQQRIIPISSLDVDATLAANQQRGVQISIPTRQNSLFVSF